MMRISAVKFYHLCSTKKSIMQKKHVRKDMSIHLPAQVADVVGEAETPIVYCDLPLFASLLPDDLYVASGV